MEIIESKENKLIKFLKKLKQKNNRDAEGQFLAEGHKFLDYDTVPEIIIVREDVKDLYIEKLDRFECKKILSERKDFSRIEFTRKLTGNNHCLF